jgi:hypothetical protein
MKRMAECLLLNSKRNEMMTVVQIPQITEFITQYRENWKEFTDGMS